MRYRIIIEVDTNKTRIIINELAQRLYDEAVTRYSTPVYLATEIVTNTDMERIK